jgi:hypothetical protein
MRRIEKSECCIARPRRNQPLSKVNEPLELTCRQAGTDSEKNEFMKREQINFAGRLFSRRAMLGGLGALAGHSLLSGCSGSFKTSSGGSTGSQPTPSGPMTQGTVTVGTSSGFSIGAAFVGLSYEKAALSSGSLFTGSNTNMIGMFKRLGASLLRIGGNSVDQTVWNPTGAGRTAGQVAPPDVDGLAAFLQATGWQVLYGINLGGSATGATNTTLAAEEVAYAVSKLGSSLYGIEIGNEPDLYGGNPWHRRRMWSLRDRQQQAAPGLGRCRSASMRMRPSRRLRCSRSTTTAATVRPCLLQPRRTW